MLHFSPVGEKALPATACEVDIDLLEGHRIWIVDAPSDLDRCVVALEFFQAAAGEQNHDVTGLSMRAPEVVVVVTAGGEGQTAAKKVDPTGLPIILAEDANSLAVLGRE